MNSVDNKASANVKEGAGREPCGLRNSELGSLPHIKKRTCFLKRIFLIFFKKFRLHPFTSGAI